MFNPNEYPKNYRAADAIDREEYELALYEERQRMAAYDAAADDDAEPVMEALNGWRRAVTIAQKAA
jgi:hypothetical protein